ncbi:MAG TPA: 3-methyl-2-oxobutanoate hydroxymethyltransferase [Armatimonadetes bacterium]|nr:3-methyl-2-oxobutanoate hydroxymethyltransferase [Armatimonadota bacterium]
MRTTVGAMAAARARGERIAMVTAYDYTSAQWAERAGLRWLLVGDSVGTVVQGLETTIPVTLDQMVYHAQMVVRGTHEALVVADLPFLTYADVDEGLRAAGRLFQEAGVQAVKLEGAGATLEVIAALVERGLPVMAHLGYTPQSAHAFGRQIVRGKTVDAARRLLVEAREVAEAGAFAVVLECLPAQLAARVTAESPIPTIGIGSGPDCDGQVQVWHDVLGLNPDFTPRHAGAFADLGEATRGALETYREQVAAGEFPTEQHSTQLPEETMRALIRAVGSA